MRLNCKVLRHCTCMIQAFVSLTSSLFKLQPFYRCPIIDALQNLINGLEQQIKKNVLSPFDVTDVEFIEIITDPLVKKIDDAITTFTTYIVEDLNNGADCSSGSRRRFLQESTNTSLANKIDSAIAFVNQKLEDVGITILGTASPYFDRKTFSAGVTATLDVKFEQSAAGLIAIIGDFLNKATADAQKLGIASTQMPSTAPSMSLVDFQKLLSK